MRGEPDFAFGLWFAQRFLSGFSAFRLAQRRFALVFQLAQLRFVLVFAGFRTLSFLAEGAFAGLLFVAPVFWVAVFLAATFFAATLFALVFLAAAFFAADFFFARCLPGFSPDSGPALRGFGGFRPTPSALKALGQASVMVHAAQAGFRAVQTRLP